MNVRPLVSVVDDDESIRESLPDLLQELGYAVRAFSSAEEYLLSDCMDETKCLLLDLAMPGMSGQELQLELQHRGLTTAVVFITAHAGVSMRPLLIAQGAIDCLFKPFSDIALRDALTAALSRP